MNSRAEYFKDLLVDCIDAVDDVGVAPEQQGIVIAALIQSDSYNGLRKALMQAMAQRGDRS